MTDPATEPPAYTAPIAHTDRAGLRDVPRWITLGFAPVMAVLALVLAASHRPSYDFMIAKKEGPIEWATVIAALIGVYCGVRAIRLRHRLPARWLRAWVILLPLGLFYMAGEELSWGQHVFKWEAPEFIAKDNRQNETNLHNHEVIGRLVGQKPKQLVEIWSIVGCVIIPLVLARRPRPDPTTDAGYWFWPTLAPMVAAVLATVVYLPTRIGKLMYDELPNALRLSELQEYYFALILAIYVGSIYLRLRDLDGRLRKGDAVPAPIAE